MGKFTRIAGAVLATIALPTAASATLVQIDSTQYGCTVCAGPLTALPGTVVTLISPGAGPNQLTLGPGTYKINNGALSGYYSAWSFGAADLPWLWSFVIVDDATKQVFKEYYVGDLAGSQAAMAAFVGTATWNGDFNNPANQLASTTTAGFVDTFTLSNTMTLDFIVNDFYLSDNTGGVAVNIESVPEPGSLVLLLGGLMGFGFSAARRVEKSQAAKS